MKRLFLIILFSLAVTAFIIAVHQLMTVGLSDSYWIFMLSLILLFLYQLLKGRKDNPL